jgi:adenine deaminase
VSGYDQSPPSAAEIFALRHVAAGSTQADVAIRNGRVVHVHTGEIREADIVITGRHIAAITPPGRLEAKRSVDAGGAFLAPTFIDAHIHIECTLLATGELARISVPRGTTALFNDPNGLANIVGQGGMDWIGSTSTPIRLFEQTTPDVPRRGGFSIGGAGVSQSDILERLARPSTVSLGEANPYLLDEEVAEALSVTIAHGKRVTGHTARFTGEPLWSYLAGGVGDDHNAATIEEVLERLRLGAITTLQLGSMTNYIKGILSDPKTLGLVASHICFAADDKHVDDLFEHGHIDQHVREAVALGVDPALAIRMASWNAASHFRVDHLIGSLTPLRLADFQLLPDLVSFEPTSVWVGGEEVARDGKPLFENHDVVPVWVRDTVRLGDRFTLDSLKIAAPAGTTTVRVRAMEMYDGYYKRAFEVDLPVDQGQVVPDPSIDVAKIAILDRHHASAEAGIGFVRGFGLTGGALAATTNCDNGNIVVVGTSDRELWAAARALEELGGGYVAVADGKVVAELPLPIGGVVSDQPWETVLAQSQAVNQAARKLGCEIHAPFMIIAFVGLNGVPDYGLTERGLIDVPSQQLIDVVI